MAGAQISTSVTIIDSLSGFMALSLTEYNTSAAADIAAGSKVEIAGAFFNFPADETPTGWAAISTGSTAYIALTASGTAGSQVVNAGYVSTAPTWRDDLQGWYASAASSVRIVASVYKAEETAYGPKYVLTNRELRFIGKSQLITTAGAGTWTAPANVRTIRVTCVGGGGGSRACTSGQAAGGGSGGSTAVKTFNVEPGSNYSYVVGAGGASAGSNTTFTVGGITITGTGGVSGTVGTALGSGGTAVIATGGDINILGGRGGDSAFDATISIGGEGGGSFLSPVYPIRLNLAGSVAPTTPTNVYGVGGPGHCNPTGSSSTSTGSDGAILIEY